VPACVVFYTLLLTYVLCVSASASSASPCTSITATNGVDLEKRFHDCGAAVLLTDIGRKQNPRALAEMLLQTSGVKEESIRLNFSQTAHHFSDVIRPAFANPDFPAFALLVMVSKVSMDSEYCLSITDLPCRPQDFRFSELEKDDIVFVNPAKSRFRLCDMSKPYVGCAPPPSSAVDLFRYHSRKFELLEVPPSNGDLESPEVIGDIDGQDKIFQIIKGYAAKRNQAKKY